MNNLEPATIQTPTTTSAAEKKPYATPRLIIHGNASELTQQVKTGSTPDTEGAGSFTPQLL